MRAVYDSDRDRVRVRREQDSNTDDSAAYATDNLKQTMSEYHEEELPV